MQIGGNANAPSIFVTFDPDGVLTMPKGTRAVDTTTGVEYVNEDGGAQWWPSHIPSRAGFEFMDDMTGTIISSYATAGGGVWTSLAVAAANPGVRQGSVGAAGVDACLVRSGGNSLLQLGGGKYRFRAIVKLPTLSDGTNNIIARVGPTSIGISFADAANGCYFEYDLATHGDHNWRICGATSSVRTKTNTGIAATTNFVRMDLIVSAACDILSGRIDGVATPTVSTNLPSAAGRQMDALFAGCFKQLGAGALTFHIDRFEANQVLTAGR
jgi:hypothetical protein